MKRHVRFIQYIVQQVEFSKGELPLLESAPEELTVNGLGSKENDFGRTTTDTPTKRMNYYPDIIRHKVAL